MAKVTRRFLPKSSATCSAYRAVSSRSSTAIPHAAPFGLGTYGSRSAAVGGAAIAKAVGKIIDKGRKIAGYLLEASEQDIEFADDKFTVSGTDRSMTFGEVAGAAYFPPDGSPLDLLEPGLEEPAFFDPVNVTFPGGCHVAEVEIDPDTGELALIAYTAVDDVGVVLNPMVVEGQIHGGVVQGAGQALGGNCVYDPASGQLLTGSFMDYRMPRADDLSSIAVATQKHAVPAQPAWRQGVRGGWHHRLSCHGDECGGRRAAAPTLLFFHGGYWQRNAKEGFSFVAEGPRSRICKGLLTSVRTAARMSSSLGPD